MLPDTRRAGRAQSWPVSAITPAGGLRGVGDRGRNRRVVDNSHGAGESEQEPGEPFRRAVDQPGADGETWIGPVLAPILVSVALVVGSLLLLRMKQRGTRLHFPPWLWGLVVTGGGVVILSFTLDFRVVLAEMAPPPFRWWLFAAGMACGGAALALGVSRLPSGTTNEA